MLVQLDQVQSETLVVDLILIVDTFFQLNVNKYVKISMHKC